jgi:hypothetical protein
VPRGDPTPVVAVGETAAEAFGAVLQGLQPDLVRLLEAFQHGSLADFAAPGGYDTIDRKLHEQTFRPYTRGLRWGIRDPSVAAAPASPDDRLPSIPGDVRDLLEELNLQQAEIDRRKREFDGVRRELYATWYRWVAALDREEKTLAATVDALALRRDRLLADVERLSGELANLVESKTGRPRGDLWDRLSAAIDKLLPGFALEAVDDVRFWRPRDPVVLLAGPAVRPSPRHGQDGRYRKDGRLACRLSGEETAAVRVANVPGAAPGDDGHRVLDPGELGLACDSFAAMRDRLPAGIGALFDECVLLTAPTPNTGGGDLAAAIRTQLPAHLERFWPKDRRFAQDEPDMRCLPEHRAQDGDWRLTGRFPSLVACTRWSGNPWLPLFLQWQVEWTPQAAAGLEAVEWDDLGTEYPWPSGQTPGKKQTYEGSALLTPSVAASLGQQLRRSDLARRLPGLDGLASEVAGMDLLCQALAGFTDRLLMHRSRWEPPPLDPGASGPVRSTIAFAVAGIDRIAPVVDSSLLPLRAGTMRLVKLWVVDAFGQVLELPGPTPQAQNRLAHPALPARLRGTGEGLQLKPRLAQGARLVMEWPPARSGRGACGHDPICGWILPNLLDASLSIYDAKGNALGALQAVRHLSREAGAGARREAVESFHWVDVPGSKRSSYGEAPGKITEPLGPDADPGLQAFTAGLLSLTGSAGPAFGALLDAIDEALGADRSASSAVSAGLALLIGQPLALVRAQLRLELDGPPAQDQGLADVQSPPDGGIGAVKFPVRLGDRRAWNGTWLGDDGLVGYFLDGDYGRFYPAFGLNAPAEIDYLKFRHQPSIAVDKPLELTLLLDPSRGVSVSSGILPRAHFSLPYADAAEVLEHKEVFFYTGPLVSPQGPLRIPEPSDIYGEWSWTHRPQVQVWHAPQPVVDIRNERARFLDDRMRLAEGWLRLVTAPLQIRTFGIRGLKPMAPAQGASGESGREAPVNGGPQDALFAEYEAPAAHPLVLSWAVTGADEIRLQRDGEELLKTGRHPLPTRYLLPNATETLLTLTATTRPTGGAAPDECTAHVRVRLSGER